MTTEDNFNEQAQIKTPTTDDQRAKGPTSRIQIDQAHDELATPTPRLVFQPTGPDAQEVRRAQDDARREKIIDMRQRLEQRRGLCKEAFDRHQGRAQAPVDRGIDR